MNRLIWLSRGEGATLFFGSALGRALISPAWIGLSGPLGAGKTLLVQGVVRGLGHDGRVKSPSFVLEHRYQARHPIRHLDLYRLEVVGDDLQSSWEDDGEDAVVLVEWAERVAEPPAGALWVRLCPIEESMRWISLEWDPNAAPPLRDLRLDGLFGGSSTDPMIRPPGASTRLSERRSGSRT